MPLHSGRLSRPSAEFGALPLGSRQVRPDLGFDREKTRLRIASAELWHGAVLRAKAGPEFCRDMVDERVARAMGLAGGAALAEQLAEKAASDSLPDRVQGKLIRVVALLGTPPARP